MGEFFRRIYYLVNRRKMERDLANDIEFHREMMDPEYRRDFGNTLRVSEESREAWGWMWLDRFVQDVRYGFRTLMNSPGFTLVAVLALGLGIGANTALFSVVYGVLLKPLPYAQGQQLVVLNQKFSKTGQDVFFSVKEIADYREQAKTLSQLEEYHQMSFILLGGQEPDQVRTGVVSAHFFDLLGIKPLLGRFFTDSDDKPGADAVLVLSYPYWQKRFGGDREIIGRQFRMNDKVHTVIGVLPPIPQYPRENDVYMPTVACPFRSSAAMIDGRNHHMMNLFGRLRSGVSVSVGATDVAGIASRMRQAYPAFYPADRGFTAGMDGLQDQLTHRVRPMLWVLLATAGLVLLIACANVANLALARTMRREQELAVRAAVGASRGRLVRQLLTESTMLSLAGGAVGLLLATGCTELLKHFVAGFTTRAAEISISTPVLLFTLVVSVVTGLVFGSVPAFFQRLDLVNSLKEGTNTASGRSSRHTVRNALVMGQVALSFMLLIGAGLMIHSFVRLQRVDAGYNAQNVLTVNVPLNFSKYKSDDAVRNFFDEVLRKLEASPGIQAAALNSGAPLAPGGRPSHVPLTIENRPWPQNEPQPETDLNIITPETLQLMDVPLIKGRYFTEQDTAERKSAIISLSFARHFFSNEDPIGRRISGDAGKNWVTIVGVVADIRQYGLDQEPLDLAYVPFAMDPNAGTLMVKTAGNPLDYVREVRNAVYSVDPEQPITDVKTLDELRGDSMAATRLTSILLLMFAGVALAIAATGLSGVTALLVSQRTREIGIRMALGAQRTSVLQMFVTQAMKVILSGLAIGLVGALLGARLIEGLLFSTPPHDPLTFTGVALLFVAVALMASYIPARRISKVSPLIALRSE
jgi:predicted permease